MDYFFILFIFCIVDDMVQTTALHLLFIGPHTVHVSILLQLENHLIWVTLCNVDDTEKTVD